MKKVTVRTFLKKKRDGEKITMLTAYDYPSARLLDEAGIDAILVGDSLGMVIQGHDTTLPVTVGDVIYHVKAVRRGVKRAMIIADMPFLSYQVSDQEAVRNAGLMLKEGGADAVKLEGGRRVAALVKKLVDTGIPVMGHLGLTPQSVHVFGGFRVQGRTEDDIRILKEDAKILEDSGVFSIVLESVPVEVAKEITEALSIPTIGIGAGPYTDGQVLVFHDYLGLFEDIKPKFVKRYRELGKEIIEATREYIKDVKSGKFPAPEHSFFLDKLKKD